MRTPFIRSTAFLVLSLSLLGCATAPNGKRVDVGGHRLRVHATGQGSPAVVFDSGLGDTLESWTWVGPDVAKFTRVVTYDRAGLGYSEEGPAPRTSERIAGELHDLLESTGVPPPYVLVGHSFGALNVLVYADRYPEGVAGIVLIEPTPPDFPVMDQILRPEDEQRKLETSLSMAPPAVSAEMDAINSSADQARKVALDPTIPVVVVSSTRPEASARFRLAWQTMQAEFAETLAAEDHVVLADSGHYPQFDQPEQVVAVIRQMVLEARVAGD